MKVSKAQLAVLRRMGRRHNALVNGDEGRPQWWIDGGGAVHANVARALIDRKFVKLTGREGGHPGILLFTATQDGRDAAFQISEPKFDQHVGVGANIAYTRR